MPGAVRRRRQPLRDDAAADDARRPPRADDPARDALRPRADRGRRGSARATPESLLATITAQREWGDFGLTEEELLERFRAIEPLNAGDALRAFYEAYAERVGKPRWGEKTPIYVKSMRRIERALPEARFVHVIRDGRDVALSIRDRARQGASDRPDRRALGAADHPRPRAGQAPRPLQGDPLRGADPRHRADAASGLRVLRAALGRRAARLPRALRRAARGDEARASRRRQAHDAQRRAADGDPRAHDREARPAAGQPLAREHGPLPTASCSSRSPGRC